MKFSLTAIFARFARNSPTRPRLPAILSPILDKAPNRHHFATIATLREACCTHADRGTASIAPFLEPKRVEYLGSQICLPRYSTRHQDAQPHPLTTDQLVRILTQRQNFARLARNSPDSPAPIAHICKGRNHSL